MTEQKAREEELLAEREKEWSIGFLSTMAAVFLMAIACVLFLVALIPESGSLAFWLIAVPGIMGFPVGLAFMKVGQNFWVLSEARYEEWKQLVEKE